MYTLKVVSDSTTLCPVSSWSCLALSVHNGTRIFVSSSSCFRDCNEALLLAEYYPEHAGVRSNKRANRQALTVPVKETIKLVKKIYKHMLDDTCTTE